MSLSLCTRVFRMYVTSKWITAGFLPSFLFHKSDQQDTDQQISFSFPQSLGMSGRQGSDGCVSECSSMCSTCVCTVEVEAYKSLKWITVVLMVLMSLFVYYIIILIIYLPLLSAKDPSKGCGAKNAQALLPHGTPPTPSSVCTLTHPKKASVWQRKRAEQF